jgi:hypothetical protein
VTGEHPRTMSSLSVIPILPGVVSLSQNANQEE